MVLPLAVSGTTPLPKVENNHDRLSIKMTRSASRTVQSHRVTLICLMLTFCCAENCAGPAGDDEGQDDDDNDNNNNEDDDDDDDDNDDNNNDDNDDNDDVAPHELIWAEQYGGESHDDSNIVKSMDDGRLLIVGETGGGLYLGDFYVDDWGDGGNSFIAALSSDGEVDWAIEAGSFCTGISLEEDGDLLFGGLVLDLHLVGDELVEPHGDRDVYLARVDQRAGALISAQSVISALEEEDEVLTVDGVVAVEERSAIVTGLFIGPVTFGVQDENPVVKDFEGMYLARFDNHGRMAWLKTIEGRFLNDLEYDLQGRITTVDDSIVITGTFAETIVLGKGEANETTLESVNIEDMYIAKFNLDGELEWAKSGGSRDSVLGRRITVGTNHDIWATGHFYGKVTFNAGESSETTLVADEWNSYIAKYDTQGNMVWAGPKADIQMGATTDIAVIDESTVVVVSEVYDWTNDIQINGLVVRMDITSGLPVWYEEFKGSDRVRPYSVAVGHGTATIVGGFHESITFGAGQPNETHLRAKYRDLFIAHFAL